MSAQLWGHLLTREGHVSPAAEGWHGCRGDSCSPRWCLSLTKIKGHNLGGWQSTDQQGGVPAAPLSRQLSRQHSRGQHSSRLGASVPGTVPVTWCHKESTFSSRISLSFRFVCEPRTVPCT